MGSEIDVKTTEQELEYRSKNYQEIRGSAHRQLSCCSCGNVLSQESNQIHSHPIFGIFQCENCKSHFKTVTFSLDKNDSVRFCHICGRQCKSVYGCKRKDCSYEFCKNCIKRNSPKSLVDAETGKWKCFACNSQPLWKLRGACAAIMNSQPKRTKTKKVRSRNISSDSDDEDDRNNLKNISFVRRNRLETMKKLSKKLQNVCDSDDSSKDQDGPSESASKSAKSERTKNIVSSTRNNRKSVNDEPITLSDDSTDDNEQTKKRDGKNSRTSKIVREPETKIVVKSKNDKRDVKNSRTKKNVRIEQSSKSKNDKRKNLRTRQQNRDSDAKSSSDDDDDEEDEEESKRDRSSRSSKIIPDKKKSAVAKKCEITNISSDDDEEEEEEEEEESKRVRFSRSSKIVPDKKKSIVTTKKRGMSKSSSDEEEEEQSKPVRSSRSSKIIPDKKKSIVTKKRGVAKSSSEDSADETPIANNRNAKTTKDKISITSRNEKSAKTKINSSTAKKSVKSSSSSNESVSDDEDAKNSKIAKDAKSTSAKTSKSNRTISKSSSRINEQTKTSGDAKLNSVKNVGTKSLKRRMESSSNSSDDDDDDDSDGNDKRSKNPKKRKSTLTTNDETTSKNFKSKSSTSERLKKKQNSDSSSGKEFKKSKILKPSFVALKRMCDIDEDLTTSPVQNVPNDEPNDHISKDQSFALKNSVDQFFTELKKATKMLSNDIEIAQKRYRPKNSLRLEDADSMILDSKKLLENFRTIVDKSATKIDDYYDNWCTKTRVRSVYKRTSKDDRKSLVKKNSAGPKSSKISQSTIRDKNDDADDKDVVVSDCDMEALCSDDDGKINQLEKTASKSKNSVDDEDSESTTKTSKKKSKKRESVDDVVPKVDDDKVDKNPHDDEVVDVPKRSSPTMSEFSGRSSADENFAVEDAKKKSRDKTLLSSNTNEDVEEANNESDKDLFDVSADVEQSQRTSDVDERQNEKSDYDNSKTMKNIDDNDDNEKSDDAKSDENVSETMKNNEDNNDENKSKSKKSNEESDAASEADDAKITKAVPKSAATTKSDDEDDKSEATEIWSDNQDIEKNDETSKSTKNPIVAETDAEKISNVETSKVATDDDLAVEAESSGGSDIASARTEVLTPELLDVNNDNDDDGKEMVIAQLETSDDADDIPKDTDETIVRDDRQSNSRKSSIATEIDDQDKPGSPEATENLDVPTIDRSKSPDNREKSVSPDRLEIIEESIDEPKSPDNREKSSSPERLEIFEEPIDDANPSENRETSNGSETPENLDEPTIDRSKSPENREKSKSPEPVENLEEPIDDPKSPENRERSSSPENSRKSKSRKKLDKSSSPEPAENLEEPIADPKSPENRERSSSPEISQKSKSRKNREKSSSPEPAENLEVPIDDPKSPVNRDRSSSPENSRKSEEPMNDKKSRKNREKSSSPERSSNSNSRKNRERSSSPEQSQNSKSSKNRKKSASLERSRKSKSRKNREKSSSPERSENLEKSSTPKKTKKSKDTDKRSKKSNSQKSRESIRRSSSVGSSTDDETAKDRSKMSIDKDSSSFTDIDESLNRRAKEALLVSSNSDDDSTSDERESSAQSASQDRNDAPPTPPESDSKSEKKSSDKQTNDRDNADRTRRKRAKFRLSDNRFYMADEKLKQKCSVRLKRLKNKILKRYSRAIKKSKDYVESMNIERLVTLDNLDREHKKAPASTSGDEKTSAKDLKRKRNRAAKEKEETLLDHLNRVEKNDNVETNSDSDAKSVTTGIGKDEDTAKSEDRLLIEANKMAKKQLLESSDSDAAEEQQVSDAKEEETEKDKKKKNKEKDTEKEKKDKSKKNKKSEEEDKKEEDEKEKDDNSEKSSEDEEDKDEKKDKSRWRKNKILTSKISNSDTEEEEEKCELSQERLKKKAKAKGSQSDSDEKPSPKKRKKRVRRQVLHSDSDVKLSSDKSESDSSSSDAKTAAGKKKKKKSDGSDDDKEKKKTRKRTRRGRRSSDSSSSLDERPKQSRRKRIKTQGSDSDSENDKDESPGKSGRKNIRKVLRDTKVAEDTKQAAKEEEERLKRIADRQKLYNEMYEVRLAGEQKVDKLILDFDEETKEPLVTVDETLVKRLKPHQAKGIKFMWDACFESVDQIKNKKSVGSGCILAHCMGLGKSFQIVTLSYTLLSHPDTGVKTVLVVCPLSTVLNWANEFKIWLADVDGGDDVEIYEMTKMKKHFERKHQLARWRETGGVMIIGYEMFRNLSQPKGKKIRKTIQEVFQKCLVDPGPDLIVCDEGHLLKKEDTAVSKAMRRVKTLRRIVLTGTPLQNNLIEYHCMVQFVKPNLLGSKKEFMNRFENPITNGQFDDSTEYDVKLMKKRAHILHKLLEGSVQRFDYSVLTPFLPPKQEYVIFVKLTEIQVKMYQHYLDNYARKHRGVGGSLFADFQALQRIWTHPMVMQMNAEKVERANEKKRMDESDSEGSLKDFIDDDSDTPSSTASSDDGSADEKNKKSKPTGKRGTRANPVVEEAVEESDGEETAATETPSTGFDNKWWTQYVKDEDFDDLRSSAKLMLLFRILKESEQIGDKILVFSQSLYSLTLIERFLELIDEETQKGNTPDNLDGISGSWSLGLDYFRLDGQTTADNRRRWCDIFNRPTNTRARLFLISTRAGGLGINLTAANRVVIFDASWNPSHDVQSIFRIYRFGQKKPCYVYRLLAGGTMEEKIYNRQVTKLSLSCRVVDEQQIERHYSNNALAELYQLELPDEADKEKILALPKDRLLAEIFSEYKDLIARYHEHDSLLENQTGEELDEEELKQAWAEYEDEKKGKRMLPPVSMNPYLNYQDPMLMQQINMMNLGQQAMNNPKMIEDFQKLQGFMEKDYPGLTEAQQKMMASRVVMDMYNYVEKQAMAGHGAIHMPNLTGLPGAYGNPMQQGVGQNYLDLMRMQQQPNFSMQNQQITFANNQQQLRADLLRQQQQLQQFGQQNAIQGQSVIAPAITIEDDDIMEVPTTAGKNSAPTSAEPQPEPDVNPKNKEE